MIDLAAGTAAAHTTWGEREITFTSVENAISGLAKSVLLGDDGPNLLVTYRGEVDGRGGTDTFRFPAGDFSDPIELSDIRIDLEAGRATARTKYGEFEVRLTSIERAIRP